MFACLCSFILCCFLRNKRWWWWWIWLTGYWLGDDLKSRNVWRRHALNVQSHKITDSGVEAALPAAAALWVTESLLSIIVTQSVTVNATQGRYVTISCVITLQADTVSFGLVNFRVRLVPLVILSLCCVSACDTNMRSSSSQSAQLQKLCTC